MIKWPIIARRPSTFAGKPQVNAGSNMPHCEYIEHDYGTFRWVSLKRKHFSNFCCNDQGSFYDWRWDYVIFC